MSNEVPAPLAFVAMPFRTRPTGLGPGDDGPQQVNFDAIWDKAISPALTRLGYIPIRADNQAGSVIIKDMLEQLVYADLVVADISIDNANVYYEAGIRHGTQAAGCVLIGAHWAQPVFDLGQIRQVRYPLPARALVDADYENIRQALNDGIAHMENSRSPVYELTNYPDAAPSASATSFREAALSLSRFQEALRSARLASGDEACDRVRRILEVFQQQRRKQPTVAKELLELVKDCMGWSETLAFIESLPKSLRDDDYFAEQHCLARAKLGNAGEAIAAIEQLIERSGETAERRGLLGGRYKRMAAHATDKRKRARYLDDAIEQYTRGMQLDLNEYFCACNLPRLLKMRNEGDDRERAAAIGQITVFACERARELNAEDPWLKPTLLGAAFDAEDIDKARALQREIERGDHAQWQLESTLLDLRSSADQVRDDDTRAALELVIEELTGLVWIARAELEAKLADALRNAPRYNKTVRIKARPAADGESVVSQTADGRETQNSARTGDYLVENQTRARERYLVAKRDFERKYRLVEELDDGWAVFEPNAEAAVHALLVDDEVLRILGKGSVFFIEAPWGAAQRVRKDDYLASPPDFSEVYRVARAEFEQSYAPA